MQQVEVRGQWQQQQQLRASHLTNAHISIIWLRVHCKFVVLISRYFLPSLSSKLVDLVLRIALFSLEITIAHYSTPFRQDPTPRWRSNYPLRGAKFRLSTPNVSSLMYETGDSGPCPLSYTPTTCSTIHPPYIHSPVRSSHNPGEISSPLLPPNAVKSTFKL